MGFYEQIADEYDEITGESARTGPAEAFLTALCGRYRISSVIDVACGTGLHAVMLARMGLRVCGADISEAMLAKAEARGRAAGAAVQWVHSPMQEIARNVAGPFNAVLCLGNSLPHLLEEAELDAAVSGFAELLSPGGVAVVGLLNYARVLARRERVVGITRAGGAEFIRFYDFLGERVRFNVLTVRWSGDQCTHELASTTLRPYTAAELSEALGRRGFGGVELFTGMAFQPFDEAESDTLLAVARRGA